MNKSTKTTPIFLSSILLMGMVAISTILTGGKFAYAISDPISSPVTPSASPIVSEPITPSPSPVVSPSPSVIPSPVVSPSPAVTPMPQAIFKAQFFNNEKLKGKPVYETTTSDINYDWGMGSPAESVNKNKFSASFKGTKYFEGGRYRVTTSNDDGLRLIMDGHQVHSAWYDQSAMFRTFEMDISKGNHKILVEYYEDRGLAEVEINWEKI